MIRSYGQSKGSSNLDINANIYGGVLRKHSGVMVESVGLNGRDRLRRELDAGGGGRGSDWILQKEGNMGRAEGKNGLLVMFSFIIEATRGFL
jgi:hypothetical protein